MVAEPAGVRTVDVVAHDATVVLVVEDAAVVVEDGTVVVEEGAIVVEDGAAEVVVTGGGPVVGGVLVGGVVFGGLLVAPAVADSSAPRYRQPTATVSWSG